MAGSAWDELTVIVPAYNEAESIGDTVKSLVAQSLRPASILVVDDFSTDNTGELARAAGATVVRPPANTGSKAGAQTFALRHVETEYVMAIDADTVLAEDAIEKISSALDDDTVAAACGFVLPRYRRSIWERGRYLEYLLAFTFYKPLQDAFGKPLISSGCFSLYRTAILRDAGGWSTRTMAEDMDLTWSFYAMGWKVRFVPEAVCYPIEPHDLTFLGKQLRRWSHGFLQNVWMHRIDILRDPFLAILVAIGLWDAIVASLAYLALLPVLVTLFHPLFAIAYVVDLPIIAVPALLKGWQRRELFQVFLALPAFFVLRIVNGVFLLRAAMDEWLLGRPLLVYEKGH
jgi:poly-beta-1,6-N-acetyl-D-glucosamine synthase